MAKELSVLISDTLVGTISEGDGGKLRFRYDEKWQKRNDAYPLSLSMPLPLSEHSGKAVANYIWGLLPDNGEALQDIARKYGVSRNNPFALVANVGEDLAGAIQMTPPSNLQNMEKRKGVNPISEKRLAKFLDELIRHPGQTQITADAGFFSLAGFQPKKAICWMNGKWYEPRGRTPSTHILKPPMQQLEGQIENEHFCQRLASLLGLVAAKTHIVRVDGKPQLLIERYDRLRMDRDKELPLAKSGGTVFRIHQEDMCQALAFHPSQKYQRDGGPGIAAIMKLLNGSSDAVVDRRRFMNACAFNFIIAGIDAHAKNYSILHGEGSQFRLAPLYDLISALPYDAERYSSLAMSISGERQWTRVSPVDWMRTAKSCKYSAEVLFSDMLQMIERLPAAAKAVLSEMKAEKFATPQLKQLSDAIERRCEALHPSYANVAMEAWSLPNKSVRFEC